MFLRSNREEEIIISSSIRKINREKMSIDNHHKTKQKTDADDEKVS